MRHRKRGRHLGRSPNHQRALLRNLASALFLTERETDADLDKNIPKVKGRIVTTLHKAKEVRPLVEKCITIARRFAAARGSGRGVRHRRRPRNRSLEEVAARARRGSSGTRRSPPRSPPGAACCG